MKPISAATIVARILRRAFDRLMERREGELDFRIVDRKRRSPLSRAAAPSRDGRGRKGAKRSASANGRTKAKAPPRSRGKRRR